MSRHKIGSKSNFIQSLVLVFCILTSAVILGPLSINGPESSGSPEDATSHESRKHR